MDTILRNLPPAPPRGTVRFSGNKLFLSGPSSVYYYNYYSHGQKSSGQFCNIHIFLSFLGFLTKQCIFCEIFLQFSLPLHIQSLNSEKLLDTRIQYCLLGEGRGWTCVNQKMPQKSESVPRFLSMIVGCA